VVVWKRTTCSAHLVRYAFAAFLLQRLFVKREICIRPGIWRSVVNPKEERLEVFSYAVTAISCCRKIYLSILVRRKYISCRSACPILKSYDIWKMRAFAAG
jgi:hypothetical protein